MLDHVSIPVSNLDRAAAFYDEVLAPLVLVRRKERSGAVGYGPPDRSAPVFWLFERSDERRAVAGLGLHISFEAPNRGSVHGFFDTAIRCGGHAAGRPGPRPEYTAPFYGAFVIDLDGFKIEAVCRSDAERAGVTAEGRSSK
jgi:catechol 2,3-dioxygenase-like lactoylglutathione lyase family enzyme